MRQSIRGALGLAAVILALAACNSVAPTASPGASPGASAVVPTPTATPARSFDGFVVTLQDHHTVRVEISDASGSLMGATESSALETAGFGRAADEPGVAPIGADASKAVLGWIDGVCGDLDQIHIDAGVTAISIVVLNTELPVQTPPAACPSIGILRYLTLTFARPIDPKLVKVSTTSIWVDANGLPLPTATVEAITPAPSLSGQR